MFHTSIISIICCLHATGNVHERLGAAESVEWFELSRNFERDVERVSVGNRRERAKRAQRAVDKVPELVNQPSVSERGT